MNAKLAIIIATICLLQVSAISCQWIIKNGTKTSELDASEIPKWPHAWGSQNGKLEKRTITMESGTTSLPLKCSFNCPKSKCDKRHYDIIWYVPTAVRAAGYNSRIEKGGIEVDKNNGTSTVRGTITIKSVGRIHEGVYACYLYDRIERHVLDRLDKGITLNITGFGEEKSDCTVKANDRCASHSCENGKCICNHGFVRTNSSDGHLECMEVEPAKSGSCNATEQCQFWFGSNMECEKESGKESGKCACKNRPGPNNIEIVYKMVEVNNYFANLDTYTQSHKLCRQKQRIPGTCLSSNECDKHAICHLRNDNRAKEWTFDGICQNRRDYELDNKNDAVAITTTFAYNFLILGFMILRKLLTETI